MIVLYRLKTELSNQSYFTDEQYIQFLTENVLTPTDNYDKITMQRQLLFTVLDVFEAVANDMYTHLHIAAFSIKPTKTKEIEKFFQKGVAISDKIM